MTKFADYARDRAAVARQQWPKLKVAALRDAISLAITATLYHEAVHAERQGTLQLDALDAERIALAATRIGVSTESLAELLAGYDAVRATGQAQGTCDVDALQRTLMSQYVHFNPASGRIVRPHSTVGEYFNWADSKRRGPPHMMNGEKAIGWQWPCGSVYGETEFEEDREVRAMPSVYDAIDVVYSLAGTPHTMDVSQALELYRERGWLHDERLIVDPSSEDLANTVLLFRPTVVIHDLKHPARVLAVGTAELRIEHAGDDLITSARLLGFAILDRHAKAAGWFLAHVLSMDLGVISRHSGYAPHPDQRMIMLDPPQPRRPLGKLDAEVVELVLHRFHYHFIGRAMCDDEIELANMAMELVEEGEREEKDLTDTEKALAGMRLSHLDTAADYAALAPQLKAPLITALTRLAETNARPGLHACLHRGDVDRQRFESRGARAALRGVVAEFQLGKPERDPEFKALSTQSLEVRAAWLKKPASALVLNYMPWRDRHPFDTWDNCDYGSLDILELLSPGATHGEAIAIESLARLGYNYRPDHCLVLLPQAKGITKANATAFVAAMMFAVIRQAPETSVLLLELPSRSRDDDDDDGDRRAASRGPGPLGKALETMGFRQSSETLYAYPATYWQLARETVAEAVAERT